MTSEPHDVKVVSMGVNLHCEETGSTVLSDAADVFNYCPYCGLELEIGDG